MRPIYVTADDSNSGVSPVVVIDQYIGPTNIGLGAVVTGTVTYTVQHTFDDPYGTITTWFDHPTLAAQTANKDSNYAAPPRAIRVIRTAGTGSVRLAVVQAGRAVS